MHFINMHARYLLMEIFGKHRGSSTFKPSITSIHCLNHYRFWCFHLQRILSRNLLRGKLFRTGKCCYEMKQKLLSLSPSLNPSLCPLSGHILSSPQQTTHNTAIWGHVVRQECYQADIAARHYFVIGSPKIQGCACSLILVMSQKIWHISYRDVSHWRMCGENW